MLLNPNKNYLGLKYGKQDMLNKAAEKMVSMKEYGNYQYNFYPFPNSFGEEDFASSFGGDPYLNSIGIRGNYQYNNYPFPAPNLKLTSFGKSKKKRIGWCLKKKRIVGVYKFEGKIGKRYSDGKKLPKGKRCFKKKENVKK